MRRGQGAVFGRPAPAAASARSIPVFGLARGWRDSRCMRWRPGCGAAAAHDRQGWRSADWPKRHARPGASTSSV